MVLIRIALVVFSRFGSILNWLMYRRGRRRDVDVVKSLSWGGRGVHYTAERFGAGLATGFVSPRQGVWPVCEEHCADRVGRNVLRCSPV